MSKANNAQGERFSYRRTKVAVRQRECSGMERQAGSHCGA
eukprot:IDg9238t1